VLQVLQGNQPSDDFFVISDDEFGAVLTAPGKCQHGPDFLGVPEIADL
jgi:hypothetical protein